MQVLVGLVNQVVDYLDGHFWVVVQEDFDIGVSDVLLSVAHYVQTLLHYLVEVLCLFDDFL